jgi:hypothetical protein
MVMLRIVLSLLKHNNDQGHENSDIIRENEEEVILIEKDFNELLIVFLGSIPIL